MSMVARPPRTTAVEAEAGGFLVSIGLSAGHAGLDKSTGTWSFGESRSAQ